MAQQLMKSCVERRDRRVVEHGRREVDQLAADGRLVEQVASDECQWGIEVYLGWVDAGVRGEPEKVLTSGVRGHHDLLELERLGATEVKRCLRQKVRTQRLLVWLPSLDAPPRL